MTVLSRIRRWTAGWLVSVVLVVVALRQIYLVHTHDLTPWLGGGFGMFATIDRVDHRVVRAYALTPDGEVPLRLPRLDEGHRTQMKARMMPATIVRPGFATTRRLQRTEMQTRVMPTAVRLESLADQLLGLTWTEPGSLPVEPLLAASPDGGLEGSDVAGSGPLEVEGVRVEVWRLQFDADQRRVTAVLLGETVRRVQGDEP